MNQKVIIVSHASPVHRGQVGNLIDYNTVVLEDGVHIISPLGLVNYNRMAKRFSNKKMLADWINSKKIQYKNFKYPRKKETMHLNWDQKSMSVLET